MKKYYVNPTTTAEAIQLTGVICYSGNTPENAPTGPEAGEIPNAAPRKIV